MGYAFLARAGCVGIGPLGVSRGLGPTSEYHPPIPPTPPAPPTKRQIFGSALGGGSGTAPELFLLVEESIRFPWLPKVRAATDLAKLQTESLTKTSGQETDYAILPLWSHADVKAAASGTVQKFVDPKAGLSLIIQTADGVKYYYGHLDKYAEGLGEYVKAGEIVGHTGEKPAFCSPEERKSMLLSAGESAKETASTMMVVVETKSQTGELLAVITYILGVLIAAIGGRPRKR